MKKILILALLLISAINFGQVSKVTMGIGVKLNAAFPIINKAIDTLNKQGDTIDVIRNRIRYTDATSSIQGQLNALSDLIASQRANYYVSNTGSDANTGLSPTQAWQTIAKVNAHTFIPGDRIYFKRGGEWREQLTIDQSGTVDDRIVFSAYGTGHKPIINGADVITGWHHGHRELNANIWGTASLNATSSRMMVVIANILYTQVATLAELTSASKYWVKTASTPDSVYVYKTADPSLVTAELSKRDYGIFSNKSYITISYLDARNAGNKGIVFYASNTTIDGYTLIDSCNLYRNRLVGAGFYDGWSHSTIQNCTSSWNGNNYFIWGEQAGAAGTGGHGSNYNTITHCYSAYSIHDYIMTGSYSDGTGYQIFNSTGCVIENNESDHDQQGIYLDSWEKGSTTMTARYNYVHNSNALLNSSYGIGVNNSAAGDVANIYYNLFVDNGNGQSGNLQLPSWGKSYGGPINVYNNTFYNGTSGAAGLKQIFLAAHGTNITLKNNIFHFTTTSDDYYSDYRITSTGFPVSDYNQIYKSVVYGYAQYNGGAPYTTLAAWVSASSQDANSGYTDPLFTTNGSNFTLQTGSPCKNTGVVIAGIPQINILGQPIGLTPNKGCY